MAEIIGIVSGLVNLSEAGYRISKVLYSFGKSVFKAREQINELARELDSISSAFECLADVLKTSEGLLKPTLLDTTQAILDDCERTYTEIEENVHTVERQSLKAKERAQWPFRKAKVKQLRTRLESAKATLSLMVNILNLSAGIKFLRQQAQPPEDRVEDTRQLFETSTKSVIDTQLAFDKAEKYEKRLAEQDGSRTGRRLKSSSQPKSQSHALVKARPMSDIAAEIPGFELLSLVRWNETRRDGYDSEDSQDGEDEALARYDDLKCQAPAIVRQLCDGWTGLDQDNLQGHARISAHPLAGDMPGDVNLESSLGNANEAEPSRPPKLRGLSLYDANQDEPPARFSSYSNGASRRDYGGLDPVCKSAQKSPLLRKEGNGSRSDPFSSVLPERSGYTYSGKTPRPAISSGPRSDKAKGRAFGSSIAADQKQDFSPRSKENTSNKLEDDFNLQAQPDTVDPLEENDFSDHGTSGPAPGHPLRRRSAQQPSLSSRSQQDWGLSNDQVKPENHPLRPVSHGVVPDLSFLSIHFSHCKGSGFDVINLYPIDYTRTLGHVVLKFKLNSIRDGLLKVAHVHDAAKMVVQIEQYPILLQLLDNVSVFNGREQRDTPLINLRHLSSAVGWRSGLEIGCQARIRSRLWPSTGKALSAELLWPHMKSNARALNFDEPLQWFAPAMQREPAGANWQAITQDNPVVPGPSRPFPNGCEVLHIQPHCASKLVVYSGEISLFFEQSSIFIGALTLGDLYDRVLRLMPRQVIPQILLCTTRGHHLPYSSEAANKAGLANGSSLICLAGGFDSEAATLILWHHMVTKAKELQSKGEPIYYNEDPPVTIIYPHLPLSLTSRPAG